ncbi:hypothetical protein CsSME_00026548 [Camellia sinensis var. sinensis]
MVIDLWEISLQSNCKYAMLFILSASNFMGTIPNTFSNLKNLTDFRIDGSVLSGKIPDLIGNWTKIDLL